MTGVRIRPPHESEYAACRMLLGAATTATAHPRFLLAISETAPHIAGAVAFTSASRLTHSVRVQVVPPARRRGIGTRLLTQVIEHATAMGHDGVAGHLDSSDDDAARPFLESLSFARTGRLVTVRGEFKAALDVILPLADRLLRSGSTRTDIAIVPLSKAPRSDVVALYLAEIARNPYMAPWSLVDELSSPRYAECPVLLWSSRVAGFLLYEHNPRTQIAKIPARIVAPEFQGGPTNVLVLAAALRSKAAAGVRHIEFDIPEGNTDTEKLARRLTTSVVRERLSFFRAISR